MEKSQRIAVIGAGFSGTLLSIHLLRNAKRPLSVLLFEKRERFGPGVAYSTGDEVHLLNVPAARMSALADEPAHFLDWARLELKNPELPGTAFLPRKIYGRYLESLLAETVGAAPSFAQLERIRDEVIDIASGPESHVVQTEGAPKGFEVDEVVLALGNLPPGAVTSSLAAIEEDPRYIANLWTGGAIERIPPDACVLFIGTGLTFIDGVLSLAKRGHRGRIQGLSRRGLIPGAHDLKVMEAKPLESPWPEKLPTRLRPLLRLFREKLEACLAQGADWRQVIDSLRPRTQEIWKSLTLADRKRFLRHVRPLWEIHRHRMAPEIAARLTALRAPGDLLIQRGRITRVSATPTALTIETADSRIEADIVVNCSGPECDFRKVESRLIRNLLERGKIEPDSLRMGIASTDFHTIGPLRKGELWETTAVPDLRVQAQQLALELILNQS